MGEAMEGSKLGVTDKRGDHHLMDHNHIVSRPQVMLPFHKTSSVFRGGGHFPPPCSASLVFVAAAAAVVTLSSLGRN